MDEMNIFDKKTRLLCSLRHYQIEKEVERKSYRDYYVTNREVEKILIRVVYKTSLISGSVGVEHVRKLKKEIKSGGLTRGILIGRGFSYTARNEAMGIIETISEERIPSFNIFNHYLVPKHEILSKVETEELFQQFHVNPHQIPRIMASDPAVFLIGARRGDIMKITRNSPTAGTYVTYRYVI